MSTAIGRPRVICHMTTSIDGRIVVNGWPDSAAVRREYEAVHASYQADGWICGRVTMEPFAGGVRPEAQLVGEHAAGSARREDFRALGEFDSFAFAVDPTGRLAWKSTATSRRGGSCSRQRSGARTTRSGSATALCTANRASVRPPMRRVRARVAQRRRAPA